MSDRILSPWRQQLEQAANAGPDAGNANAGNDDAAVYDADEWNLDVAVDPSANSDNGGNHSPETVDDAPTKKDATDEEVERIDLAPISFKKPRSSRRSSMDAIRMTAILQSNKLSGKKYPKPEPEPEFYGDEDDVAATIPNFGVGLAATTNVLRPQAHQQAVMLNGKEITLSIRPQATGAEFVPVKRYSADTRHKLKPEALEIFWRSATGHVLAKNNKFEVVTIKKEDENLLLFVKNLQTQMKLVKAHCYAHDMSEVFTIVVPDDVFNSPHVGKQTFDLFRDYATLHPAIIANSNTWYNNWVKCAAVRQNLQITFEMLKNNTETNLWSKAFEDHEEFDPIQQGGPLVLYFILKRILDVSETSIRYLVKRVRAIKLSSIPGENVEDVVSIVKSTYKVLKQCSTDVRNHVPDDFPELVLQVFQTSSTPNFNSIFAKEVLDARSLADKTGGLAKFPSVSQTCTLALNSYRRMTGPGDGYDWVKPSQQGSAFFSGMKTCQRVLDPSKPPCFNCGENGCTPSTCDKPLDQDKIDKAKAAHQKKKDAKKESNRNRSQKKNRPRPTNKKDEHGRPLMRNKNGAFVVDQKKHKAALNAKSTSAEELDKKLAEMETQAKEADDRVSAGEPVPSSFTANAADIRAMVAALRR